MLLVLCIIYPFTLVFVIAIPSNIKDYSTVYSDIVCTTNSASSLHSTQLPVVSQWLSKLIIPKHVGYSFCTFIMFHH